MTKISQPIRADEPVLVRRNIPRGEPFSYGSGLHSYNAKRRIYRIKASVSPRRLLQFLLFIVGIGATGYYAYTLSDQFIYQKYENWAFDQQIGGRTSVTFGDYVREQTPLGFLVGRRKEVETVGPKPAPPEAKTARPGTGALLGRVSIGRLSLAAIVREGVDDQTLRTAVGHVPSTSLPGQPGNFAIAAHRDTLFRALKDIKKDDLISFQSADATYTYQVAATKIVKPSDVSVLRPDGGGLLEPQDAKPGSSRLLTMITCYPFYYVGAAPKRFIVEAKFVWERHSAKTETAANIAAPAPKAQVREPSSRRPHKRRWHGLRAARP
jgi:sortase A